MQTLLNLRNSHQFGRSIGPVWNRLLAMDCAEGSMDLIRHQILNLSCDHYEIWARLCCLSIFHSSFRLDTHGTQGTGTDALQDLRVLQSHGICLHEFGCEVLPLLAIRRNLTLRSLRLCRRYSGIHSSFFYWCRSCKDSWPSGARIIIDWKLILYLGLYINQALLEARRCLLLNWTIISLLVFLLQI